MKKDIEIPEVKDVHVAAVRERNEEYYTTDWNAYIINNRDVPLETVLIVSKGYDDKDSTAVMRHSLNKLPPKSFAKIEFLEEEVLRLNNEFAVTYFADGKMYEKKFLFKPNTVKEEALKPVPVMQKKGVLAE